MKIEITPASVTLARRMPTLAEPVTSAPIEEKSEVTLSSEGKAMAAEDQQVRAEAELTKAEIQAKFSRIWGDPSLCSQVFLKYRTLGAQAFAAIGAPAEYTPEQIELFEKSQAFLVNVQRRGEISGNPFSGLSRAELSVIIEDETGYTEEERLVADYELDYRDNEYFKVLGEYTSRTNDHRPMAKGYLEYLDNLSPVERLKFPSGERDRVAAELQQAELEHGSLPEGFSIWELMEELRRTREDALALEAEHSDDEQRQLQSDFIEARLSAQISGSV